MDQGDILIAIIAALPGLILALIALKKSQGENRKVEAETAKIHAEISEAYAQQVEDLQEEVKGLRLDLSQVRRENEQYRQQLEERDATICDVKHWAEQLVALLKEHAPQVVPPEFVRPKVAME